MSYVIRPFAEAVAVLRKAQPKLREQKPQHYDAATAYSSFDLAKWPRRPPLASLYLMKNPALYSDAVMTDAKTLVEYANFGSAIGTWNANGTASWTCAPAEWIIASVSLTQEQAEDGDAPGDHVNLLLALFRTEEGVAAAVLPSGERELLRQLIGLEAFPTLAQHSKVWYGE